MLFDDKNDSLMLGYIKRNDSSLLHRAVKKKKNNKVRQLLDQGVDANMTNNLCETPLHYAIKTENYEAAEMLIKHGVDLEIWDSANFTAFGYAIQLGYGTDSINIIELLLEYGADIDVSQGDDCKDPLKRMLENWDFDRAQILLHFGAYIYFDYLFEISEFYQTLSSFADLFLVYGFRDNYDILDEFSSYLNHVCRYVALRGIKRDNYMKLKNEDYYKECIEELERMKTIFLDERISSYDYVKASRNQLINYSKNKNLCDTLERLLEESKFTNYEDILRINIVIGDRYRKVYEKVSFDDFAGYSLPILVRDNILKYLNERDINNFIRAQREN